MLLLMLQTIHIKVSVFKPPRALGQGEGAGRRDDGAERVDEAEVEDGVVPDANTSVVLRGKTTVSASPRRTSANSIQKHIRILARKIP